ncbi:unnamed protein product, partial [Rhizophagus irregularis]
SFWPLINRGPIGTLFYGMFLYPKVFFDHYIMENPTYSLSIYQETILRSIKWTMKSPLKTLRKSGTFRSHHRIGVEEGYWLGPIKYKQKNVEATILYLHGGGYVALSSLIGLRSLCYLLRKLRKRYNKHVRVLAIDYTLAPEDPFPNGLNCVERTYNWLVNSGLAALLHKLYSDDSSTTTQTPLPLGVILGITLVELSCDSSSFLQNAEFDWIPPHLLPICCRILHIRPLHIPHHIMAKFPPLFISYGGKEIFKDDIEKRSHPDVTVETDEDMVHDYPMFIDVFGKRSKKALDRIVHFIANNIPLPTPVHNHYSRIVKSRPRIQSLDESAIKFSTLPSNFAHDDRKHSIYLGDPTIMQSFHTLPNPRSFPNSRRIPSIVYIQ